MKWIRRIIVSIQLNECFYKINNELNDIKAKFNDKIHFQQDFILLCIQIPGVK
jgi:hypothetical protein